MVVFFFFFKQKTAYEITTGDWSSDVCSSDLGEIRKILRTQGQHNIALVGAGRLGQAIASSPIFAEHGINIAAVFDRDPEVVGRRAGGIEVRASSELRNVVREKNI